MSSARDDEHELAHGRVSLRAGALQGGARGALAEPLENLAAAAAELLQAGSELHFSALFATLGSREQSAVFRELTLISPERVYVVQRDLARPETALVAVSPHAGKLGLLLSKIRARLTHQEPGS
jgi:hypothetical protein